jgi:hypothetical protein
MVLTGLRGSPWRIATRRTSGRMVGNKRLEQIHLLFILSLRRSVQIEIDTEPDMVVML